MFGILIESSRTGERGVGQALVSAGFHLALGVAVIQATVNHGDPTPERPRAYEMLMPEPMVTTTRSDPGSSSGARPVFQQAVPMEFPVVDAVPDDLPPLDIGPTVNPRRFAPASSSVCRACTAASPESPATVYTEATVDQAVEPLSQPSPVYPAAFETAGIEGRVVLQYVVDTTGVVEVESIRAVESSHAAFAASAARAIARSRFRPARVRGRPVRQLVQQALRFTVGR